MSKPVKVFISYAHEDEPFKNELVKYLSLSIRNGLIELWHDRKILAGSEWGEEIDNNLEQAQIILCLVSANFFASNYCYGKEMTRGLERHEVQDACVIPVLVSKYPWKDSPLHKLNGIPRDNKPVESWKIASEAWTEVASEICTVAKHIQNQPKEPISKQPQPPTPKGKLLSLKTFKFEVVNLNDQGEEVRRWNSQAEYFVEPLSSNVNLEMVEIPGGTFWMGATLDEGRDVERPQHLVTVSPFLMSKYPVTQAQWSTVSMLAESKMKLNPSPSEFKGKDLPVENVSWYEAVEFCERLSRQPGKIYRLPSEAEWEYACRAGTTTRYHAGNRIVTLDGIHIVKNTVANVAQSHQQTSIVGSFLPNQFGLFDMHGNVWEWCEDVLHENYQGAPIDGSAWVDGSAQKRIMRGGCWQQGLYECRSACRGASEPKEGGKSIGFRVVLAYS